MSAHTTPAPTIPGPDPDPQPPKFKLPPGACDCHAHVFGPYNRYPLAPTRGYVPPEASIEDYVRVLRTLGCERAVIVHPSVYGTDNRCTVDALRSGKFAFRGVVVIDDKTTDSELEDMHRAGVRGVRINLKSRGSVSALDAAPRLAERIRARGWHMQFFLDVRTMPEIDKELVKLPVDIVIDHFGHVAAADGLQAPGFQALLRLARHERCWFKLIGPYRLSQRPPMFPDVAPFARALVAAAPGRCVWGTDWPHPNTDFMPNDGDLADMLLDWIPDETQRRKVLADNPARLYDF
ncbi:MAG: amidohydrolase family protein [Burkholderiales bacterium]|nr:amidohydrolase family protein [Burkholderiales bacterium]